MFSISARTITFASPKAFLEEEGVLFHYEFKKHSRCYSIRCRPLEMMSPDIIIPAKTVLIGLQHHIPTYHTTGYNNKPFIQFIPKPESTPEDIKKEGDYIFDLQNFLVKRFLECVHLENPDQHILPHLHNSIQDMKINLPKATFDFNQFSEQKGEIFLRIGSGWIIHENGAYPARGGVSFYISPWKTKYILKNKHPREETVLVEVKKGRLNEDEKKSLLTESPPSTPTSPTSTPTEK